MSDSRLVTSAEVKAEHQCEICGIKIPVSQAKGWIGTGRSLRRIRRDSSLGLVIAWYCPLHSGSYKERKNPTQRQISNLRNEMLLLEKELVQP